MKTLNGSGRTALVTGARRGIGLGIAKALLEDGYRVMLCSVTGGENAVKDIAPELDALGDWCYVPCDVSCGTQRAALFKKVRKTFDGRLDVLVNNAGVAPKVRMDILTTTEESYERVMRINAEGCFFMCQTGANLMIEGQKRGWDDYHPRIINISSISAYTSSTPRGEYCTSKAAISMTTQLFADRLAEYGIPVFEVRPGIILTDMTAVVRKKYERMVEQDGILPTRRLGIPEDVAAQVLAACSGLLDYGTGTVLNADGGFHLRRL